MNNTIGFFVVGILAWCGTMLLACVYYLARIAAILGAAYMGGWGP